ncbi:hypothetical protein [Nitrobacter sp.]|uniref:hypothetical protein n=1 Tax=Nitrobacter sp. TaxID=29420 RepID=UPI0029CABD9C|nr:hypothetical protein [Nitrobacter sp.]
MQIWQRIDSEAKARLKRIEKIGERRGSKSKADFEGAQKNDLMLRRSEIEPTLIHGLRTYRMTVDGRE